MVVTNPEQAMTKSVRVNFVWFRAINGQLASVWVGLYLEGQGYTVTSQSIYSTLTNRFRDVLFPANNCCCAVFACSDSCFWMAICFWEAEPDSCFLLNRTNKYQLIRWFFWIKTVWSSKWIISFFPTAIS